MWTKLVEIIEIRWINAQNRDSSAAKAVNSIYGSMHNCHVAFQYLDNEQNEQNFANFAFAIDGLISTLKNLNPVFQIFEPDLAARLDDYFLSPGRIETMNDPRQWVTFQIRFMRDLVREESSLSGLPEEEISDFSGSKDRLGEFILNNLAMPDLYGKT